MRNFIAIFVLISCMVGCKKEHKEVIDSQQKLKGAIVERILKESITHPDSAIEQVLHFQTIDSLASDSDFFFSLQQIVGQSKFFLGDIDSSIYYMTDCYNYWKRQNSEYATNAAAKLSFNLGFIFENAGNKTEALKHYNETTLLPETFGIYKTQVSAYLNKAKVLMDQDEYAGAIEAVEKSIAICDKHKDSTLMISSLQAYADLYTNCGFFDEANQQFQEVLNYQSLFTSLSRFIHHNNKGRMYFLQNDYDSAKEEFISAYDLAKNLDTYNQYIAAMNLTEILLTENKTEEAKAYIKVLDSYNQLSKQIPAFLFNVSSLMGEYYNQLHQPAQAQSFFLRADSVLTKNKIDNVIQKLHYKRTSKFYLSMGDYKQAYSELENYNQINKNILQTDNRRQVSTLKYKYERDTTLIAQNNALKLREEEITNYKIRQLSLSVAIIALLIILVISYLYFQKKRQLHVEKEMRKMAALKMESIRGRLSPHLIFNTINSIWDNIEDRETSKMKFENLTRLIRQCLVNSEKLAIPLNEEINFVKDYTNLQPLGAENTISVHWEIQTDVNNLLVPAMILQIPVENAIKHGLSQIKENRLLKIEIKRDSDFLVLTVKDNGVGVGKMNSITNGTGTGLKVLTNTIHILNQSNDKKMLFTLENSTDENYNGARAIIKIPLRYNFKIDQ